MGAGTLTIYSASAGSGKTFSLARIYLQRLFSLPNSYRRILAVTFTNKATAEMKTRILEELDNMASGRSSRHLEELIATTGRSEEKIRQDAREILHSILHDFSRFYISTIDSFFQKILRAFAREIGLHAGFNLEIDHTHILAEAVDNLIKSASSELNVRRWLTEFVKANIEDEKTWDLRNSIRSLSEELFREKFKLLTEEERKRLYDKELLLQYIGEIRSIKSEFNESLKNLGNECMSYFDRFSLTDDMFFYKGSGVPGFIRQISEGEIKEPNSYVRAVDQENPRWSTCEIPGQLAQAISSGLGQSVLKAIHYYDANIVTFNSASLILSNIYALGILMDVLDHVRRISSDENLFLLSDTGELIYLITKNDQAPFIYEKVGNIFDSFMIDEFQDTSVIQWNNFRFLVENSMAQGGDNLVVGDIKQSIYRWRNSDWRTLNDLRNKADGRRLIRMNLDTNYRSRSKIIEFNNALFSIIPLQIDEELEKEGKNPVFRDLFSEAVQKDPGQKHGGFVRIEFLENTETPWCQSVLEKLPGIIESLQDRKYRASDIGILVRNNREGADVLKYMIEYSANCPEEKMRRYNFNIVSADSLLLSNSPAVNFLLSLLAVLADSSDMISRAAMLRLFLLSQGRTEADKIAINSDSLIEHSSEFYPAGFIDFLESLKCMTLWDITERAIGFFGLGEYSFNVPYLNSFQDIVLNFTSGKSQEVVPFLDWWESEGTNKSISLPEQQDSIQVMTIHKSKGLEFEIVILPFISWNLDHKALQTNIIWVRPGAPPFNKIPIVPVRYKKDLASSIFAEEYFMEKYSAYLDNLNLLYVAMTRAKSAIYGFAPEKATHDSKIASVLKCALTSDKELTEVRRLPLHAHYDDSSGVFEYGELAPGGECIKEVMDLKVDKYPVSFRLEPLKLKLHWEDYFRYDQSKAAEAVNYGKLMHEIFGEIFTLEDVVAVVRKKVLEGKITAEEELPLIGKINSLISGKETGSWFEKGNEVLNEIPILVPESASRRPDRIILKNGKVIIVDFKFGEENPHHRDQLNLYRGLLYEMGYKDIQAFLWYVDVNKILEISM